MTGPERPEPRSAASAQGQASPSRYDEGRPPAQASRSASAEGGAGVPPGVQVAPGTPSRRRGPLIAAAALTIGLAAALASGTMFGSSPTDPAPSAADVAQMTAEWDAAQAAGIALPRVPVAQQSAAVESLPLPPADRESLRADLKSGKTDLVFVTVWDTYAEDGDVVELISDNIHKAVTLKNAHIDVALPMPRDGIVVMRGMKDGGGGGITVGVVSGGKTVRIPPMQRDQTLRIPVR